MWQTNSLSNVHVDSYQQTTVASKQKALAAVARSGGALRHGGARCLGIVVVSLLCSFAAILHNDVLLSDEYYHLGGCCLSFAITTTFTSNSEVASTALPPPQL